MKIAIALFDINNPGGIIGHTEQLALGFRELGHTVDLISLEWTERQNGDRKPQGIEQSVFGTMVHPYGGWDLKREMRVPYKGSMLASAQDRLSQYDGVVWTIPCPRKRKDSYGNTDWMKLYEASPANVGVIHDGNLVGFYPNLVEVLPYFNGFAGVHPCAYETAKSLGGNVEMIVNPMPDWPGFPSHPKWRRPGFLAAQTFKGWKRVDMLIKAIRYMSPEVEKHIAGGGIEHCYMTSETKCKEQYFHEDGVRIWDAAMDNGMQFHGFITATRRDEMMTDLNAYVDPSYSARYAKIGSHFNRVIIEAMRMGCIPIAQRSVTEHEGWLEAGKHYVALDADMSDEEYAYIVELACHASSDLYMEHWVNLIERFDRRKIAQQYIQLGLKKKGQFEPTADIMARSAKIMPHFYGEK